MSRDDEKCVVCNEDLVTGLNLFTEKRKKEAGMCEVCFDDMTFDKWDFGLLDNRVVKLVREIDGLVLAGGALRKVVDPVNEVIADYDLFVLNTDIIENVKTALTDSGFELIYSCPEGKLYSYKNEDVKVQLINIRGYNNVQDIIDSFDITASCAAWDGSRVYKNRKFISHVLNKIIDINIVEYPKATLNRIVKYVNKGYKLSRQGNSTFVETISGMVIDDVNGRFYVD